ncbi:MAG: orotate phosphoribosyltransferase [Parcubacteria group bacterium Gr01-1014_8]|nr:MAG: orotate phosphoribosyltransferase [Parcubacteria group bacterium Gr01-1014_8]
MTEADVLDLLERVGAFRKGHFVLTSGRHGDTYINKDAIYPYTRETSALCRAMAEKFKDLNIEVVVGPAVGAAILSQWVAYHLSEMNGHDVLGIYADKDGQGGFILKRGFDKLAEGKRVIVVEDLMTTGGSVKKVIDVVRQKGAEVVGVGVVCNRGNVLPEDIGDPPKLISLVDVQLDSWEAADCALCERKIPVNPDIGHGREFLATHGI